MNDVVTVGIDLAKNVFTVHGVDAAGRVVLRRTVTRAKLPHLAAQLPRCLIELASIKLDLEIVKKAAAYFAKESR